MKLLAIILFLLLSLSGVSLAQEPIRVTGQFDTENTRAFHYTETAERLLFVRENGELVFPVHEWGYFFKLTDDWAQKLGTTHLVVIFINEMDGNIPYDYDLKTIHLELEQLSDDPYVYYTKNHEYFNDANGLTEDNAITPKPKPYPDHMFQNPSVQDTLFWDAFMEYNDLRDFSKWLDKLGSEEEITVKSTMYLTMSDGTCLTDDYYETRTLGELAEQRMHNARLIFDEAHDSLQYDKALWKAWFERTINPDDDFLQACNSDQQWNEILEKGSRFGIFTQDAVTEQIYRIESSHYANYKDQRVIVFDDREKMVYRRKYASMDKPYTAEIVQAEVLHDTLYTLTEQLEWRKHNLAIEAGSGLYTLTDYKKLLPDIIKDKEREDIDVQLSYTSFPHTYIIYRLKKDYYVLAVNTATGGGVYEKTLKELLKQAGYDFLEEIRITDFGYANKSGKDFVFGVQDTKKDTQYLLKLDKQLQLIAHADFPEVHRGSFLQRNNELLLLTKNNIKRFDQDLKLLQTHPIKTNVPKGFGSYTLFSSDDDNIRMITDFRTPYKEGLMSVLLDNNFQTIKEECVYNFTPLENDYVGSLRLQYITKVHGKWKVYFRKGNRLRYLALPD